MFGFLPRPTLHLCAGIALSLVFQSAGFAAENDLLSPEAGNWATDCLPNACTLGLIMEAPQDGGASTDGSAIQIVFQVDKKSRKGDLVVLTAPPDADEGRGLIISFAKTVPDGDTTKMVVDKDTFLQLRFDNCDEDNCEIYLKEGKVNLGNGQTFDVTANFLKQDVFLAGFFQRGVIVRQSTALTTFKSDYDALVAKAKSEH